MALVVTIVVLLILATVSISAVFSDTGIIKQAQRAKDMTANSTKYEEDQMKQLSNEFANAMAGGSSADGESKLVESITLDKTTATMNVGVSLTLIATITPEDASNKNVTWSSSNTDVATVDNGTVTAKTVGSTTITVTTQDGSGKTATCSISVKIPSAGDEVSKPDNWTSDKVTPIEDGSGNTIPLPKGFYYVGGDRETGLVISDKQGDTLDASGTGMGNQFVWIPVDSEADLERTNFDENGQPTTGLDTTNYTEPYAKGYSDGNGTQEAQEYNTMKTQVLKYGGFYIGRFEAGVNSTTLRTGVTTAQTVVCKKKVAPYNHVPWGESSSNIGSSNSPSGAVYLAKNMYSTSQSVTSTLIYGCQWDAMCRYIGIDNQRVKSDYNVTLTGSDDNDVSKNIYDLAGNCMEWTMESSSKGYKVPRPSDSPAGMYCISSRNVTSSVNGSYGFRNTIHIK